MMYKTDLMHFKQSKVEKCSLKYGLRHSLCEQVIMCDILSMVAYLVLL